MYKHIKADRLYEQIVSQIEDMVFSGDLKVGDQLPPERDLAERFGVSRTAVREAVKALAQKGLVVVQPGRGTFVTDGTSRALRHSLTLMVRISGVESARNLVEVREIFEPEISALAALRATSEQIDTLRRNVDLMDQSLQDVETFIEADLDFHLTLAEATQNDLIPTLLDSIIELLREDRKSIFLHVEGGASRGQFHHKRILDAIAAHDAERARAEMRAHLEQIRADSTAGAQTIDRAQE